MRLNIHAKVEIALVTVLLLTSCSGNSGYDSGASDDVADIARANSVNALSAIEQLESRVSEVEGKVELNERNIDTVFSNAEEDRRVANANAEILNRALDRLDRIEAQLGL